MLHVVPKACVFTEDRTQGSVVIESDVSGPEFQAAFAELESVAARHLATTYAGREGGLGQAHINGNTSGAYPVNSEGTPLDRVVDKDGKPVPALDPRMRPRRYRIDVPVVRPLR